MRLRGFVNNIVKHKEAVLMGVIADPAVRKIMYKYNIDEMVISNVVTGVHNYFIKALEDNNLIGSCPAALEFIQSMKKKNFAIEDLFMLCIRIREALVKEIIHDEVVVKALSIDTAIIDVVEEILIDVNTIFDANLSSVLGSYYNELTSLVSEYNKAVDASNIVSKTDSKGIITFVNDEFCKISGYTRDELIGKPHNIVRHPHTQVSTFQSMWETIKAGNIWKGTIENLAKTGGSYFVNATIVPILDTDGRIIEYIGIRHDITALVNHEKQMEVMREKLLHQSVTRAFSIQYQDVVNAIPLPAILLDNSDNVLLANPTFWSFFTSITGAQIQKDLKSHLRTFGSLLKSSDECISDSPFLTWREIAMSLDEGQCIQICFIDELGSRYELKISTISQQDEDYHLCVMRPKEV